MLFASGIPRVRGDILQVSHLMKNEAAAMVRTNLLEHPGRWPLLHQGGGQPCRQREF